MKRQHPIILGIETSCDDTACALLDGDGAVLSSVISSQLAAHRPYGGVVPEIASREHLKNWPAVSRQALEQANLTLQDIDVVAATKGPGLIGALLVGLSLGKGIAYGLAKPFHAVHHLEGHLYSPFMRAIGKASSVVPESFVGLVVSGGHTSLFQVLSGSIESIAETRDDAMGEVFDKVGKYLGLAYPQGPKVDALAELGDPRVVPLSIARCSDQSLDFSYSGLKSQTLLEVNGMRAKGVNTAVEGLSPGDIAPAVLDLLAGFRTAAVAQILDRLRRLYRQQKFTALAVSGGAAANLLLRRALTEWTANEGIDLHLVALDYSSDNAAMIAHAALLRHRLGLSDDPLEVDASSRIPLSDH
jgi:N6-L-threonylcarbamoyladenine synthase